MLDQWLLTVWEEGVHEYLSPTYYGTDLDSLNLIARYAGREDRRRDAAAARRLFWTDIAANWNEQGQRLGGAHSRDYDYLTGHGYLDHHLIMAKWLDNPKWRGPSIFQQLYKLDPPAGIREAVASAMPRTVHQRWGRSPWQRAIQYVGKHFAIGSSGANYGPMDKPLTVNLPGHRKTPVVNFFMDARGDAYGRKRFAVGGGHSKALHLTPFIASVQRGPEVLLFASGDAATGWFGRYNAETTCLRSHLVLPMDVELWLGGTETAIPKPDGRILVPHDKAVFLRIDDVAVGIRFPFTRTPDGEQAPVELVADGAKWRAMRLTCVHAPEPATGHGQVAVWVRVAEGLDEKSFAAFRRDFMRAKCTASADGAKVSLKAEGRGAPLSIDADLETGRRTVTGDVPGAEGFLLAVDGRDWGREILGQTEIVKKYRRFLAQAEADSAGAPVAGKPIEAERAVFVVPPFRVGEHADATGGKFVWMPGEPSDKGGSRLARAVWFVNVAKPGTYYLWARVMAPTPDDDSFFVCVRQKDHEALPLVDWHTGVHQQWTWTPVKIDRGRKQPGLELKAGVTTVEFGCRENGTRLDAFALTTDPTQPPAE